MAMIRSRRGAAGRRRWQWRVRIAGLPARHGTCPTKKCAEACAKKAEEEVRAGRVVLRLKLTALLDAYEAVYLPTIPDSAVLYRQELKWWRRELGDLAVRAITPRILSECKVKLAGETTNRKRPRSPATVNRYFNSLSSVFTWACGPEIGLADHNPVRDVARLKEPAGRVRWLRAPA